MLVKPSQLWSNLIKLGQTCFKLVLFGTGHYNEADMQSHSLWEMEQNQLDVLHDFSLEVHYFVQPPQNYSFLKKSTLVNPLSVGQT